MVLVASTLVVTTLIIVVVLQMLDRAEEQAERIRSVKVAGAQGSGNEFKGCQVKSSGERACREEPEHEKTLFRVLRYD